MANPKLIVSEEERDLIMSWIASYTAPDETTRSSLGKLLDELKQADVREEKDLPVDVVRVNSVVTFRSPTARRENLQLVMPKDADLKSNRLSVFTVMGSALMGYREGADIHWRMPKGEETIHLEKVDNSKCLARP